MKPPSISFPLAPMILSILLQAVPARAGNQVEDQLNAEYRNRVLTLRHSYKGDHLVFQPDGSLLGLAALGPWTVDGQISVASITVGHHALRVRGRRVFLVFDAHAKPFRDVLDLLEESNAPEREKQEKFFQTQMVEIEIGLASENAEMNEASTAMNAIFLAPGESMTGVVPAFWRDYFDQREGLPRSLPHVPGLIRAFTPGGPAPPHAIYNPDPAFSEEARQAKYQGTMTVSLVVDASGAAQDLQIVTPLGLGLDENAIEAVGKWKFEPGTNNGQPVPTQIMVEVDFHLY